MKEILAKLIVIASLSFFVFFHITQAFGQTTLSIQPASSSRNIGDLFALEIKINTAEKILGADIDLTYDPTILEAQKISPGNFFPNLPLILTNNIDAQKGLINLSLFSYPTQEGNATLATILFKALRETTQSANVNFEPTTALATAGDQKILFAITPATVEISPKLISGGTLVPKPLSTSTPGAIALPSPYLSPSPAKTPTLSRIIKPLGILFFIGGIILLILVLVIL